MKKHILLVLAAILVMGIQSCSKDEVSIEENQGLPENVISADELLGNPLNIENSKSSTWYIKTYVKYGRTIKDKERMQVLEYFRTNVFSEIFVSPVNNSCLNIDTWYIPCEEINDCGKPDTAELKVNENTEDDGELAIPYDYKIKILPPNTHCVDL